MRELINMV